MTKSKLEELIKEAKNFREHIDEGTLEIGQLSERINEYNSFSIVNIEPKQYFKFDCALNDIRSGTYYGARINWNSGTFSTGSEEFDTHIRTNTRIDEFLEKFAKSKNKDYSDFKALYTGGGYEEELSKEGIDIGYYKLGVSGNTPQAMVLEIYNPQREEWEKKLSLTPEVYKKKLKEYKETQNLITEFNTLRKGLNKYSKADSELYALKEKLGVNDESLKKMFNVSNLHMNYESIEKLVDEKINEEKYAKAKQHELSREEVDKKLNKLLLPFEKGIPKGRIQLGGSKKPTEKPDLIPTGVVGTFSHHYVEGTSIPAGSVSVYALFDANGNFVSEYSNPEKVDFSKGVVVHKEIAQGGENYAHWLFYVDKKGKISQVAEFNDYYSEIIPIVGNPESSRQIWYGFHSSDTQNRRHNDFKYIDDWAIIPFKKTHWGGFPNPRVPLEHGLVYHNTETKDSLIIEKVPEIMLPHFIADGGKLNLKADVLRLNGDQIDKSNGWIDIVKTEGTKAYIDIYEIIDFNHLAIAGLPIYKNANPTDPLDSLIKREYDNKIPRKAGPQIRHSIKLLDLKKGSYDTLSGFTDSGTCGYEHYSMPAEKGILVVSRETGKKEHIY